MGATASHLSNQKKYSNQTNFSQFREDQKNIIVNIYRNTSSYLGPTIKESETYKLKQKKYITKQKPFGLSRTVQIGINK